jgi:protease IV
MKRLTHVLLLFALAGFWAAPGRAEEPKSEGTAKPGEQSTPSDEAERAIPRLAELRLDEYVVPARAINLPFPGKTRTVQDILDQLDEWSRDDRVGAVLMDVSFVPLSIADVQELRDGIAGIRSKGKKVLAFLNGGSPTSYLVATAADEIVIPPSGSVAIPGIGAIFPFMKGYYQMVGLEYDVITAGKFKYPGFLNRREPGPQFVEVYSSLLDSWIMDYKAMVATRPSIDVERAEQAINKALFNSTEALQWGLVDNLAYYDDYRDQILRREKMRRLPPRDTGLARVNSLQDLMGLVNEQLQKAEEARRAVGPKIAVVHARGPIVDFNLGPGFASQLICRDDFIKVVEEVRRNRSIKAVVLRVDSPGGSGFASDMIWERLRELAKEKPLVVNMGRVAASGGYYIACPAHRIFAQSTTITGSIGVLGVFQSAWSLFNRMDYEFAEMKRGDRALLGSPHRTMSPEDRQMIQDYITDFYGIFIDRVATTRKMPAERVREIAEGRVYTGHDALKVGLIDEIGGLADAVASARKMANIPPSAEIKIVHYPRPSSLGEMLESFSAVGVAVNLESLTKMLGAAPTMSLEQQASLFSHTSAPLCWLPIPPIWELSFFPPVPPNVRELLTPAEGATPHSFGPGALAPLGR